MKVIQVPYCFYPDQVGGTEIYTETLSKELQKRGIDIVVSCPSDSGGKDYFHNGLKVRKFEISKKLKDLSELYGEGDTKGKAEFGRILDEEKPDIVHLHAFTRGVSLLSMREAKKRKIPVIFTYHTPTVSCQRGTLLRWGKKVCDGILRPRLCAQCTLHKLGLPRGIADFLGWVPIGIDDALKKRHLSGGIWTTLRMHGLSARRFSVFKDFMDETDYFIVLCKWARRVLLKNGVPEEKITVIRHGISNLNTSSYALQVELHGSMASEDKDNPKKPLRIVYIGRLDPDKGVDILIRALKFLPTMSIKFDIYGIIQTEGDREYLDKLKKIKRDDSRIMFKAPIPNENIIALLKKYHILASPSNGLETGPFTVMEAFAAGIPVIGSNLGGIAELVKHRIDGILVSPNSVREWSREIKGLCQDRDLLRRLKENIRFPRSMDNVTDEVLSIYHRVLKKEFDLCEKR